MNVKEKPLIDAVSQLGALPNFFFSNPVVTGFFAAIMCAVFGAVALVFQVVGRGEVDMVRVYETARLGAGIGLGLAAIIFAGIAASAYFQREEARYRLLFVVGGVLGGVSLVVADQLWSDAVRRWLSTLPPMA